MSLKLKSRSLRLFLVLVIVGCFPMISQELYEMPEEKVFTRWTSFENQDGLKGAGAKENQGAKGHAFDRIPAGEGVDLVNITGSGVINRIWLTVNDRSPEMLRSLKIEMYWDGREKPAVSVPLGDFFGVGLGRRVAFESTFFTDPEGRSFNCFIPMPFKEGARISIVNESEKDLNALFYEVNLVKVDHKEEDVLYFHAYWNRELETVLSDDFEILPRVAGKGRFLGTNIGVLTNPKYEETWWGEGEVKIYLDKDSKFPTLVGSGTEDYIGTAWGQGTFDHLYQGSLIADKEEGAFAFYRYHITDPVYFYNDIKVDIQQIGGAPKEKVRELLAKGAELVPVTVDHSPHFTKLLEMDTPPKINQAEFPDGWTNFYRKDDVSATAYFYLNKPENNLPEIQDVNIRVNKL
ncbi:glycoside hydrolase family 172 protein [Salegentibacter sp. F14]